ncbi:hypothetical protein BLOT_007206 [Blomia tropicalis]|nr:hypothetical protein BLOT_007206 [Blomia tropicalis]
MDSNKNSMPQGQDDQNQNDSNQQQPYNDPNQQQPYYDQNQQQPYLDPNQQQPYFDPNQQQPYYDPNQQQPYFDPNQQQPYFDPNQQPPNYYYTYQQQPNYYYTYQQQPYYDPNQQQLYYDPNQQQPNYYTYQQQPYYDPNQQQPCYDPNQQQLYYDPNQQQPYYDPNQQQVYYDQNQQQPYIDPNQQQPYLDPNQQQPYIDPNQQQPYIDPNQQQLYYDSNQQQVYYDPNQQQVYYDLNHQQSYYDPNQQQLYYDPNQQQSYYDPNQQQLYYDSNQQQVYYDPNQQQVYYDPNQQQLYYDPNQQQSYYDPNQQQLYYYDLNQQQPFYYDYYDPYQLPPYYYNTYQQPQYYSGFDINSLPRNFHFRYTRLEGYPNEWTENLPIYQYADFSTYGSYAQPKYSRAPKTGKINKPKRRPRGIELSKELTNLFMEQEMPSILMSSQKLQTFLQDISPLDQNNNNLQKRNENLIAYTFEKLSLTLSKDIVSCIHYNQKSLSSANKLITKGFETLAKAESKKNDPNFFTICNKGIGLFGLTLRHLPPTNNLTNQQQQGSKRLAEYKEESVFDFYNKALFGIVYSYQLSDKGGPCYYNAITKWITNLMKTLHYGHILDRTERISIDQFRMFFGEQINALIDTQITDENSKRHLLKQYSNLTKCWDDLILIRMFFLVRRSQALMSHLFNIYFDRRRFHRLFRTKFSHDVQWDMLKQLSSNETKYNANVTRIPLQFLKPNKKSVSTLTHNNSTDMFCHARLVHDHKCSFYSMVANGSINKGSVIFSVPLLSFQWKKSNFCVNCFKNIEGFTLVSCDNCSRSTFCSKVCLQKSNMNGRHLNCDHFGGNHMNKLSKLLYQLIKLMNPQIHDLSQSLNDGIMQIINMLSTNDPNHTAQSNSNPLQFAIKCFLTNRTFDEYSIPHENCGMRKKFIEKMNYHNFTEAIHLAMVSEANKQSTCDEVRNLNRNDLKPIPDLFTDVQIKSKILVLYNILTRLDCHPATHSKIKAPKKGKPIDCDERERVTYGHGWDIGTSLVRYSCRPNTIRQLNLNTGNIEYIAMENIEPNQPLTIKWGYECAALFDDVAARKRWIFNHYHIDCQCSEQCRSIKIGDLELKYWQLNLFSIAYNSVLTDTNFMQNFNQKDFEFELAQGEQSYFQYRCYHFNEHEKRISYIGNRNSIRYLCLSRRLKGGQDYISLHKSCYIYCKSPLSESYYWVEQVRAPGETYLEPKLRNPIPWHAS